MKVNLASFGCNEKPIALVGKYPGHPCHRLLKVSLHLTPLLFRVLRYASSGGFERIHYRPMEVFVRISFHNQLTARYGYVDPDVIHYSASPAAVRYVHFHPATDDLVVEPVQF